MNKLYDQGFQAGYERGQIELLESMPMVTTLKSFSYANALLEIQEWKQKKLKDLNQIKEKEGENND